MALSLPRAAVAPSSRAELQRSSSARATCRARGLEARRSAVCRGEACLLQRVSDAKLRRGCGQPLSTRPRAEFDDSEKMGVPPGAFGGMSPEKKAASMLESMFTYIACWIVIDQTEGVAPKISTADGTDGAGADAFANDGTREARRVTDVHAFLLNFLEEHPVRDADAFLLKLTKRSPEVARRVMDVRAAYAAQDFEWENARRLALENMQKDNTKVLKQHLTDALVKSDELHGKDAP